MSEATVDDDAINDSVENGKTSSGEEVCMYHCSDNRGLLLLSYDNKRWVIEPDILMYRI